MTKTEANKALRYLTRAGFVEPETVKYERSWRIYVSDPLSGYRIHFDNMDTVHEKLMAEGY